MDSKEKEKQKEVLKEKPQMPVSPPTSAFEAGNPDFENVENLNQNAFSQG